MMDKIINISFINDDLMETINSNLNKVTELIKENPFDSTWMKQIYEGNCFELRKTKINDFQLKTSLIGNYKDVEYENAITIYENLKELPRYILCDKRFWMWLEFSKFYRVAVQAMPLTSDTRLGYGWMFKENKRGIWRNTFSRSYFWVEFTVDEKNENDKYELTKFVFDKNERIRHLTFDSKYRSVVFNTVRAEKKLYDKYAFSPEYAETYKKCESGIENSNIYTYARKVVSFYGSVRILDFMEDDDLFDAVYEKLEKSLFEVHKGNLEYIKG